MIISKIIPEITWLNINMINIKNLHAWIFADVAHKQLSAPNFLKIPWKFMSCLVCKAIFLSDVTCKTLNISHHPRSKLVSKHPPNFYLQWQKSSQRDITLWLNRACVLFFRMATAVIGRCIFGQLNKLQKCKTIAKVTSIQCRNISISQRLLGGRCHFNCPVENEQWTWRIIIHYNTVRMTSGSSTVTVNIFDNIYNPYIT